MKKTLIAIAAASLTLAAAPAAAVDIQTGGADGASTFSGLTSVTAGYGDDDRRWKRGRGGDRYDRQGRYREPRRIGRNDRVWRGDDGRYYCRRDNGTTGLIIGAGVGALAGHEIAGRGDRTLGAIIGGVAGGLLGREIDKGSLSCR
jgi:opacity protein-like surface antigen